MNVTSDQGMVFAILLATLILFVWGRWRYDIVSLGALILVFVAGLVPANRVFTGFGHPAVITVAAVLVISRGLQNAGSGGRHVASFWGGWGPVPRSRWPPSRASWCSAPAS